MDHAVLDSGEIRLDLVVDPVGDFVGGGQGLVAIGGDLHIYVQPAAKLPGAQQIQPQHSVLCLDGLRHGGFHLRVSGLVHQLPDGAHEDVIGGFQDEQADDQAGDGVQDGQPQLCPGDAHQGADGGQGIGAVMPGVRHEGGGVNFVRCPAGVPEHPLLGRDGHDGGD